MSQVIDTTSKVRVGLGNGRTVDLRISSQTLDCVSCNSEMSANVSKAPDDETLKSAYLTVHAHAKQEASVIATAIAEELAKEGRDYSKIRGLNRLIGHALRKPKGWK